MGDYDADDDRDCNTTLRLGLTQNGPKRYVDDSRVFLDFSAPSRTGVEIIESSLSIKSKENANETSQGDEEIDFFRDLGRKKLRLTKDQTTLLEDSFKQHPTLNTAQKQELAGKLCVKPRQVEVWFQNRRARSKLKQTEVEWQFLKKSCERLTEENCRLKKELVELKSKMKISNPPPAPATPWKRRAFHVTEVVKVEKCSSCEKD